MAVRPPVIAGTFYPADPRQLARSVDVWLEAGARLAAERGGNISPIMTMLPHAGHVYCGRVIGETLARVALSDRLIILSPNHTGQGAPLAVWDKGSWETPLGSVPVDEELAAALLAHPEARAAGYVSDTAAHRSEHSIEVLLPFLQRYIPAARIVPVVVSTHPERLRAAGEALAAVLREAAKVPTSASFSMSFSASFSATGDRPVSMLVSSDMHHFSNDAVTRELDELALARLQALDPVGLYNTVAREGISMCGVQPAVLGLFAALALGASRAELVAHTTSAEASGDTKRVVGYAGMIIA